MASVPSMRGAQVVANLEKLDFKVARISGSHHIMRHADGRGTTVPVHAGRDVAKGTLRGILSDVGLTAEELQNPKLVKAREAQAAADQQIDPRDGVADARGATDPRQRRGRSGGRRGAKPVGRERDGRTRR